LENKDIYQEIDKILQDKDNINYEELLKLFKNLELNIQNNKTNMNNNKLSENKFYNYIKPSYYVNKLETIYSGFIVTPRNGDER
jgi:hypothetical protein